MRPSLKVALLGVNHPHALAHLQTLHQLPEVVGVHVWAEDDRAAAAIAQGEHAKVETISTDLDKILAIPEVIYAVVCVRNDRAPDVCRRALNAGKHVMAEKPIGRTAADVGHVVATAQEQGRILSVCYQNRRNPLLQEARRLIGQGLLGPLMTIELRMLTTQVQFRDPGHWLFSQAYAGGGMLSWLGCHSLDMLRYLTGDEVVSVMAEVATRSGEAIDVEDTAILSMRLASGAVASLHTGYTLALSGGGYHNSGYDSYVGINGRTGRLYWSTASKPSHLFVESTHPLWRDAPSREFEYGLATSPAYGGVSGEEFMREFIAAIHGEGEPPSIGHDALQIARIVDAAYESSRTGRRIEVEPPRRPAG